jgi:hypothetical protein
MENYKLRDLRASHTSYPGVYAIASVQDLRVSTGGMFKDLTRFLNWRYVKYTLCVVLFPAQLAGPETN